MKTPRASLDVLCDEATGHVFAACGSGASATGDNAPDTFHWIARDGQRCERIELDESQLTMDFAKLFASHRVLAGRLVPCKGGETQGSAGG